jgi:hypothetical protein
VREGVCDSESETDNMQGYGGGVFLERVILFFLKCGKIGGGV